MDKQEKILLAVLITVLIIGIILIFLIRLNISKIEKNKEYLDNNSSEQVQKAIQMNELQYQKTKKINSYNFGAEISRYKMLGYSEEEAINLVYNK